MYIYIYIHISNVKSYKVYSIYNYIYIYMLLLYVIMFHQLPYYLSLLGHLSIHRSLMPCGSRKRRSIGPSHPRRRCAPLGCCPNDLFIVQGSEGVKIVAFLWIFYGISMGFLWDFQGFNRIFRVSIGFSGFLMGFANGFTMG